MTSPSLEGLPLSHNTWHEPRKVGICQELLVQLPAVNVGRNKRGLCESREARGPTQRESRVCAQAGSVREQWGDPGEYRGMQLLNGECGIEHQKSPRLGLCDREEPLAHSIVELE